MIRKRKWLFIILVILSTVLAYSLSIYGKGSGNGQSKGKKKGWIHKGIMPVAYREPTLIETNSYEAFTFNPAEGEIAHIYYTLSEPSLISIRVLGEQTDLLLRTLVDWDERIAGTHVQEWDGTDASGNIATSQGYAIAVDAEPLVPNVSPEEADLILNDEEHKYGHLHGLHDTLKCHDFNLRIYTPTEGETISGTITIGAQLTDDFLGYAKEWGFGIRSYVDQKLIDEVFIDSSEVKYQQNFKLNLDTTTFEDGEHTIIINICDHNEHEGTASVKVNF